MITEIIFFSAYMLFIFKYGFGVRFARLFIRPAIAAAVMVITLSFLENLAIAVITGIIIYSIVLLALRTIDKEDKRILDKIIRNL